MPCLLKKLISKSLSTVKINCKSDKYLCKEMSHFLTGVAHITLYSEKKPTFYSSQFNFFFFFGRVQDSV